MGIVLTVLEPPHLPEPNLVAALPPGTGRVIDVEPRLVSPRYDTLLVTSRGLVVRDHVSGDFHGMPWANFSVDAHLRQHSRHATIILWLNERRPLELAVTRRLALNIASVAPVLTMYPTEPVDDIVMVNQAPDAIDLRDRASIPDMSIGAANTLGEGGNGWTPPPNHRQPLATTPPRPSDRFDGLPPPRPAPIPSPPPRTQSDAPPRSPGRRRRLRLAAGFAVLVLAGAIGGAASILINGSGSAADGSMPTITSEAVDVDQSN